MKCPIKFNSHLGFSTIEIQDYSFRQRMLPPDFQLLSFRFLTICHNNFSASVRFFRRSLACLSSSEERLMATVLISSLLFIFSILFLTPNPSPVWRGAKSPNYKYHFSFQAIHKYNTQVKTASAEQADRSCFWV